MSGEHPELHEALKRTFGFDAFRPLQEEIILDSLAGRDVFALLPTGGGKSLCFQLPALLRPGLTVVVSPLIALMKDQVDALRAAGVRATFLNSSLAAGEARERVRGLDTGWFRLLYVAPERLMLPGFLDDLRRWKAGLFAIDEAHCISEWGHDFRPEYRQLAALRGLFPETPMMALTATATERVRQDIVAQLHLRNPQCYVASFNRPNLTYRVSGKTGAYQQVHTFVRERPLESGIIYCQSRKGAEQLAEKLRVEGIRAAAYHAGLEAGERSRNQENFLRDEVRVICATIAFGMGINKPNVRFVIHYDLPKNIESYYQETGRAGRDGLPGECLLLFSPGDSAKYGQFIDEKPDPKEREIARAQLRQIVHYAECSTCRRVELLAYFGETFPGEHCGACDNCLSPRETWDGTVAAQKFLSCVYRVRERSGFGVGMNHIIEVLTGGHTEKIRKWGHDSLSTYNIGNEHTRGEWGAIGRELIRMGFLRQSSEKFSTLELVEPGVTILKGRQRVTLTRPIASSASPKYRSGEIECDEPLFEALRILRKQLADARDVPAYIVFSDVALRQMARYYPTTPAELARISGVGEKKLQEFGAEFMEQIASHLRHSPRRIFSDASVAPAPSRLGPKLTETVFESVRRFRNGEPVDEIARRRDLTVGTIYGHLATAIAAGESFRLEQFFSPEEQAAIEAAFAKHGFANLTGVVESLSGRFNHGQLRVYRALAPTKRQL